MSIRTAFGRSLSLNAMMSIAACAGLSGTAMASNIAGSGNIIATSAFGTSGIGMNTPNNPGTAVYLADFPYLQQAGIGYDFGGSTSIDSLTVYYDTTTYRERFATGDIYTSAGVLSNVSFNSVTGTDANGRPYGTVNFATPVNTSFIYIHPTTAYNFGDHNAGISELAVDSPTGIIHANPNIALNKTVTSNGWSGTNSGVTSGNLVQHSGDNRALNSSNPIYNYTLSSATATTPGNYIQIDLGQQSLVGTIAIDQGTQYNADNDPRRDMIQNFKLVFSNTADFSTVLGTQDGLSLANDVAYQQVSFSQVTAQFVRLEVESQYVAGTTVYGNQTVEPNHNLVVQQLEVFVPEPASLGLLGISALGLAARRRRN